MKSLHMVAWFLVIIGALNWGLVGIGGFMGSNWNVVNLILGSWPAVEWIVYVLVGLSGVWLLVMKWNKRGMHTMSTPVGSSPVSSSM